MCMFDSLKKKQKQQIKQNKTLSLTLAVVKVKILFQLQGGKRRHPVNKHVVKTVEIIRQHFWLDETDLGHSPS